MVTNVPFWDLQRGSCRRIDSLLRHLARHFSVSVCWIGEMPTARWMALDHQLPGPLFGPGQPARWQKWWSRLRHRPPPDNSGKPGPDPGAVAMNPMKLEEFRSEVIGQYVARLTARLRIDVVILQYVSLGYIAGFIRRQSPATRVAIDTHDVMHARQREFERQGRDHWLDIDRASEAAWLGASDAVIAIQSEDAREFSGMLPGHQVLTVPYACPPPLGASEHRQPGAGDCRVVGFLGSDGDANRIGLIEFLHRCWPVVRREFGDSVRLIIAGPIDRNALGIDDLPNVEFCGAVDELADFYNAIDVAINPAVIRSGLKIKSLEALAWGVPLVTTTAGIAGIRSAIGQGAFVEDDWELFAGRLTELLAHAELRNRFSAGAVEVVRRNFVPETAYAPLVAWINRSQ